MTSILLIAGGSAIIVFLLLLIQLRYDRLVKEIWRSLKSQPSDAVFTQGATVAEMTKERSQLEFINTARKNRERIF